MTLGPFAQRSWQPDLLTRTRRANPNSVTRAFKAAAMASLSRCAQQVWPASRRFTQTKSIF